MKLWALDRVFQRGGGHRVDWTDLEEALRPMHQIRERVGMNIELMLDGHGFFSLPAARCASRRRCAPSNRCGWRTCCGRIRWRRWARFAIGPTCRSPSAKCWWRGKTTGVRLQLRAADYVMIDPTWVGGVSESRRIADLAQVFNVPALMHDCTGPLTLMSGLHISAASPNVTYQETVRAHIHTLYPNLLDQNVEISKGHIELPQCAGLGVRLLPELFTSDHPGYRITRL